jgi:predicted permease
MFSWIRTVLLNPLPGAAEPERVVALEEVAPSGEPVMSSYLDYRDFRDRLKLIESMSVVEARSFAAGDGPYVRRVWGQLVSGNFFDVLRVQPEMGRFFEGAERDDAQNAHPVVVIAHSFWKNQLNSNPNVLGTTLRINQHELTVIGVAPDGFQGSMPGLSFDVWMPATMYGELTSTGDWMLQDRKTRMFRVVARLAPGANIDQARQELKTLAALMAKLDADTNEGMSATLLPMRESHFGLQESLQGPLMILMGTSCLVLLIVCANVANLLLARATSRRKEFGVRLALGATRPRLVRQILTETLLMAVAGSALGLLLASWLGGSLRFLVPASVLPDMVHPVLDRGVLLFAAGLAFLVAALAGIAPALHAGSDNVNDTLKESGRGGSSGGSSTRLRGLLVGSEMALAVVALVGAGLFLKSFYLSKATQTGFDPEHVAVASFNLSAAGFDAKQADAFCRRLREQLEKQPGITAASYADYVPLSVSAGSWEDLQIEGYVAGQSENMKIYRNLVAPGYFDLMKIPLVEGRDFTLQDDVTRPPVMIVSREFVHRFVPHGAAIGRKVNGWGKWFTIVGVAEDIKVYRVTEKPAPYFYVPIRQVFRPEMGLSFYARSSGPVNDAITALRRESNAVDPTVPVFDCVALTDYIAGSLFAQKIAASLLSVLAGIAFLLAAIGLYGVMAYSVAQRTNEIGIRVTLGAQPAQVLRMVLKQGLVFAATGIVIGSVIVFAVARLISAALVYVSPADPVVYAIAGIFTVIIALAATLLPARRAMRVDPMVALRHE